MADLEADIPEEIEHELDRLVHGGASLGRQQEEQVDVGTGRQRAAPIAANGGHREAGRVLRIDMGAGKIEDDSDQLVLNPGDSVGAVHAAAIFEELQSRLFAGIGRRLLQDRQELRAGLEQVAATSLGDGFAGRTERVDVEEIVEGEDCVGHGDGIISWEPGNQPGLVAL